MNWHELALAAYSRGATVHQSIILNDFGDRATVLFRLDRRRLFGNAAVNCYCLEARVATTAGRRAVESCLTEPQPLGTAVPIVLAESCRDESTGDTLSEITIRSIGEHLSEHPPDALRHGFCLGTIDLETLDIEIRRIGRASQRLSEAEQEVALFLKSLVPGDETAGGYAG